MQTAWENFVKSGSIYDYLVYKKKVAAIKVSSEREGNADYNKGNSNP